MVPRDVFIHAGEQFRTNVTVDWDGLSPLGRSFALPATTLKGARTYAILPGAPYGKPLDISAARRFKRTVQTRCERPSPRFLQQRCIGGSPLLTRHGATSLPHRSARRAKRRGETKSKCKNFWIEAYAQGTIRRGRFPIKAVHSLFNGHGGRFAAAKLQTRKIRPPRMHRPGFGNQTGRYLPSSLIDAKMAQTAIGSPPCAAQRSSGYGDILADVHAS